jgi:hypothetical protein
MKNKLLLTLAAGLLSASPLMAVDLYVTGATAFRANVHDACKALFDVPPTVIYGTAATGGNGAANNGNAQWTMTGTVSNKVSVLGTTPLNIHGLFTGSIQGVQTVEQGVKLIFLDTSGNPITNTPTIAFSDASSVSSPFPASGNFSEEKVCVQPFVMTKSVAGGGMNSVSNVTWEQLKYAIQAGRIPLAAWSGLANDLTNFVYLIERTKDSGTRRTETAQENYAFNQAAAIYIYDATNNFFYKTTSLANAASGSSNATVVVGVVGAAGNNNANISPVWGSGYVGGGDIKTELQINNAANQAMAYLSIADAKGVTGVNWSQVVAFNGLWPTAAGPGISGNTVVNDYSPIINGMYPCWGYEVLVYPNVDPSSLPSLDQNLTAAILGVLDSQTVINGGSPLPGSIEASIVASKPTGATAVPLADMVSSRQSVGGTITP